MMPCNIGYAIALLKSGHKVRRAGWRDKSKFLWFKPPAEVKAEWCKDPQLKALAEKNGGMIPALGAVCMYMDGDDGVTPQILTGWMPTLCDLLAEDWECLPDGKGQEG